MECAEHGVEQVQVPRALPGSRFTAMLEVHRDARGAGHRLIQGEQHIGTGSVARDVVGRGRRRDEARRGSRVGMSQILAAARDWPRRGLVSSVATSTSGSSTTPSVRAWWKCSTGGLGRRSTGTRRSWTSRRSSPSRWTCGTLHRGAVRTLIAVVAGDVAGVPGGLAHLGQHPLLGARRVGDGVAGDTLARADEMALTSRP